MKNRKPSFTTWICIAAPVLIAAICLAAVFGGGTTGPESINTDPPEITEQDQIVDLTPKTKAPAVDLTPKTKAPAIEIMISVTPEPTASPTLPPMLPAGAVEIWTGGNATGLTLGSEQAARDLLNEYLEESIETVRNTGERVVLATYVEDVSLYDAKAGANLRSVREALDYLMTHPGVLPVKITTETRTLSYGTTDVEKTTNGNLAKGNRIIKQIGRPGIAVTVEQKTYVSGECVSSELTDSGVLFEPRSEKLEVGTYESKKPEEEPGKTEGAKFKETDGLKLILPIQAKISSYFGTRENVMHNGIDIPAKAGTAIRAPGEGLIVYIGERGEYGTVIDIDHGNGFISRLSHCTDVQVVMNQRVFSGETVAKLAGVQREEDTPHIHYELIIDGIPANPLFYR